MGMQQLLRQGRELSEVLVEVPVTSQQAATSANLSTQAMHNTWQERGLGTEGGRAATEQRGTLLLRLINIGREPSDLDSKQAAFDAVQTTRGAQLCRDSCTWRQQLCSAVGEPGRSMQH